MERVFQTTTQRRRILFGAMLVWLLFVASFVMPVTNGMFGWHAFWLYMAEVLDARDYWREIQRNPWAIFVSTFPSTNALMFIAPLILFRWPQLSGWMAGFLTVGGVVPLFAFFQMISKNDLRAGFYCWVISIFLMALLCFLEWMRQRRIRSRES